MGRTDAILKAMAARRVNYLVAFSNAIHSFITADPVFLLSNVKPLSPAVVVLAADGSSTLFLSPAWDIERARSRSRTGATLGVDDAVAAALRWLTAQVAQGAIGVVGLNSMGHDTYNRAISLFEGRVHQMDTEFYQTARQKNSSEIDRARRAAWIAERGYEQMLAIARPGMREYELVGELSCFMKALGADDNFLLLSASQHNDAVHAPGTRELQAGDIILAEISPSYDGQFVQICRTAVMGTTSDLLREKYGLLQKSMATGMAAAVPGARVGDVTRAMNANLEAAGYGRYCHPPYMRVRGHGMGLASVEPGDIGESSQALLEENMIFVMHPNQYVPETGYLLCGEPVLTTPGGAKPLTQRLAELDVIQV